MSTSAAPARTSNVRLAAVLAALAVALGAVSAVFPGVVELTLRTVGTMLAAAAAMFIVAAAWER